MWFSEGGEKGRARLGQRVGFLGLKGQTVVKRDGEITQRLLDLYRKNMICDNNKYQNLKVDGCMVNNQSTQLSANLRYQNLLSNHS